ncbi:MAG: hypothetical protein P8X74_14955 [Reinekea sp.]
MDIKDRGDGNTAHVLESILRGRGNLFELIKESEKTDVQHKTEKNHDLNLGGNLWFMSVFSGNGWNAMRGLDGRINNPAIENLARLNFTERLKEGLSVNGAFSFGNSSSKLETHSSNGDHKLGTKTQGFALNSVNVGGGLASIGELNAATGETPIDMAPDHEGRNISVSARGNMFDLPGVRLDRTVGGLGAPSRGIEFTSKDGHMSELKSSVIVLHPDKLLTAVDPKNELVHIPGFSLAMKRLISEMKDLRKHSDVSATITRELKPEVLAELSEDVTRRESEIKEKSADISNYRIVDISLASTKTAKHNRSLNLLFVRNINAGVTGAETPAKIEFLYDVKDVKAKGVELFNRLSELDDAVLGTENRRAQALMIKQNLDNLIQTLTYDPVAGTLRSERSSVQSGDDDYGEKSTNGRLEREWGYQIWAQKNAEYQTAVTSAVNSMLTGSFSSDKLTAAYAAFKNLLDHKRKLLVPAVNLSGQAIEQASKSSLSESMAVGNSKVDLKEQVYPVIKRLLNTDRRSLPPKKLAKAVADFRKDLDAVKISLNSMAGIDPAERQSFIAQLEGGARQ